MENHYGRNICIELPIKIKTYDTDYMQIVSNTVYVKWFEDMRQIILDKYFPLQDMLKENNSPILAKTTIKYIKPFTLNNNPIGKAYLTEVGASKWKMCFEISDNNVLHCSGEQMGYYYNLDSNKPTRWPQKFIDLFNESKALTSSPSFDEYNR